MTGKYCCYRSPASTNTISPVERSSYAQTGRAPVSAHPHSSHAWAALVPLPLPTPRRPPALPLLILTASAAGRIASQTADSAEEP